MDDAANHEERRRSREACCGMVWEEVETTPTYVRLMSQERQ